MTHPGVKADLSSQLGHGAPSERQRTVGSDLEMETHSQAGVGGVEGVVTGASQIGEGLPKMVTID